jgi:hypothetical protein
MEWKPLSAVFRSVGKMLSSGINVRNFWKYLCKTDIQGTPAHFALPGCAVTSDLSDLQLNKGTGNKAQGRRGFSAKIEELFQVDRDNC